MIILDIISDSCKRKLWPVPTFLRISINIGNRTGTAIRTSQAVQADHKKPGHIEGSSLFPKQRTPPVCDISATR